MILLINNDHVHHTKQTSRILAIIALADRMIINVRKLTGNKPMPTPKYLHLITILDDTNLGHYLVKNLMMEFPDYKSKYPFCIFVAKFQKSECNHFLGHNRGSFSQKHALLW